MLKMLNKVTLGFFFVSAVLLEICWRLVVLLTATASTCVIIASLIYAFADWRALPIALLALLLNILSQKAFYDGFDDQVADAVLDFGERLLRRRTTE